MKLPRHYDSLTPRQRRLVREEYMSQQDYKCWFCKETLYKGPPDRITHVPINWGLFPEHFMNYPVHLHHDRKTGLTVGAVHAHCNAHMWAIHGV